MPCSKKSVYNDNFPTFGTRESQEMRAFFLMYTKEKNRLAAGRTTWILLSGAKELEDGHSQVNSQKQRSDTTFQASSLNCRAEFNFSKMSHKNTNLENIWGLNSLMFSPHTFEWIQPVTRYVGTRFHYGSFLTRPP